MTTGTPVMLDVKDAKGRFFYSSGVSAERSGSVDTAAMDALIEKLDQKGMYLIARLPALRDYSFGLNHTENGLFVSSGAYLWADDDYCYWLDPTKQGTVTYLVEIVTELKNLGFDEVVFDEYRFPDTDNLKFSGDRLEALNSTAKTLWLVLERGAEDMDCLVKALTSEYDVDEPLARKAAESFVARLKELDFLA